VRGASACVCVCVYRAELAAARPETMRSSAVLLLSILVPCHIGGGYFITLKMRVVMADRPGVQIGSHINKWNLDSPELKPFWLEAETLGAVVFIHPWDMELGGRHEKHWLPWLVGMPCVAPTRSARARAPTPPLQLVRVRSSQPDVRPGLGECTL
jgi:hypothetical protein